MLYATDMLMKALAGITVLDLTRLLPGAVATQYLADQGAEVVKVEQPGAGDYARALNAAVFARTNRGKRSVAVDLKHPQGRKLLLAMAAAADILIEGFRPGVMARLGLGYDDLARVNGRLIYASLTGYGQSGEYAGLAGHDINYMALAGVLGLNAPGGNAAAEPAIPGVQIADIMGGSLQTILAVLLALQERHVTGKGKYADVSMTAGIAPLLTIPFALYAETGREPRPGAEMLSGAYACYNVYRAADGRWLAVGALEPKFWAELCRSVNCEDLIPLQFAAGDGQERVKARLARVFGAKSAQAWFDELRGSDCCVTPVRTVAEAAAETLESGGGREAPAAPKLGEHTREELFKLGFEAAAIDDLYRQGAIA